MATSTFETVGKATPIGALTGMGKGTGVPYQWDQSQIANVDPLVKYIADQRGAPHGKDPGKWWDATEMNRVVTEYMNSLSPQQQIDYAKTFDANKLSQQMQSVYGQGFNFTGSSPDIYSKAVNSFSQMMGRDPSAADWAQIAPAFQGPNGQIAGNQAIATLYKQEMADPNSALNKSLVEKNAPTYNSAVSGQFKSIIGRDPTADELSHFSRMLATNQTDAYGLGAFLKTLPEYQNAQDTQFRNSLNDQLVSSDKYAYERMGAPQIASQFAQTMGGQANSPALDSALVDLQQKMSANRSNYLAQVGVNQYAGNKNAAMTDYQGQQNQYLNNIKTQQSQNYDMSNYLTQRGYNGLDYNQQMRDYMNYMNANKQPTNNFLDYLNTGANVVGTIGSVAAMF